MFTLAKILILLMYSNLAEYSVHRFALHGFLWKRHVKHHEDDSKNVFFVRDIGGMLVALGLIGLSSLLFSFWGWLPLIVFLFDYLVLIEAAHWLIHEKNISQHHMVHHADLWYGNFNIWLPFSDYLFGTKID